MKNVFENELDITRLHESFKESLEESFHQLKEFLDIVDVNDRPRIQSVLEKIDSVHTALNKIDQFISINYFPPAKWSRIDLRKPVELALNECQEAFKLKEIKINCALPERECIAYGDEEILKSYVFENLISNAVKFSSQGSSIDITMNTDKGFHQFMIRDRGVGIDSEYLQKIKNTNLRHFHPDTEGKIGSGMSFPIIKRIMGKLNGHLEIESSTTEERGTTVKLFFHRF
jgi:signal transduction histidine kinase